MQKPYGIHWKPEEFAVQLTLIEHFLFQQIRPNTYIHILQNTMEKQSGAFNMALKPMLEYVAWFRLVHFIVLYFI